MLKLTKTGIGLLTRQYRSVLKKCWLINLGVFAATAFLTTITPKIVYAERDGNNTERWSYNNYYVEIRPSSAKIDLFANNYLTSVDENNIVFFYNSVTLANYSWNGLWLYDSSSALKSTLQNAQLTINAAAKGSLDDPDGVRVMNADGSQGRVYLYNNSSGNGHVLTFDSNGRYGGELYSTASEGGIVNLYLSGVEKTRLSATGFKLNGSDTMTGITHNTAVAANASSTVAKLVSESTLARSLNNYYRKKDFGSRQVIDFARYFKTGKLVLKSENLGVDLTSESENLPSNLTSKISGFAINHPPRLGAFVKCEKACSRLSERFPASLEKNSAFEQYSRSARGTFLFVSQTRKNVMDNLSKTVANINVVNDNFTVVTNTVAA